MEKHLEYLNQLDKNEIENFKRTWMHNLVTMKWLKTRHVDKAKKQYLFFPDELHKHYEINELFRGFDVDQSEGIDIQELISMFKDNKINLDRKDVESIFKIIDFNGDHTLNLSEFKKSVFSDDINSQFAKVMRELRDKLEKKEEVEKQKKKPSYSLFVGSMPKIPGDSQGQLQNETSSKQLQKMPTKIFVKVPKSSSSSINQLNENSQRTGSEKNISDFKLDKLEKEEEETQRVVPTTFSSMVEFFSYNFQRKEQIKKCKNLLSTQVGQKVNELSNLMSLNSKYTEHSLQKISKLSNKYRFHSFNLLNDAEEESDSPAKSSEKSNGKEKDIEQNNENSRSQFVKHRKVSQSLSPQKQQHNQNSNQFNYQISSIPEIDNIDYHINNNINNDERTSSINAETSSIINSPHLPNTNVKQQYFKLNLSQSPDSFSKLLKRKNQSVDNSDSTQDKTTNIERFSSTQQLNSITHFNSNSSNHQQINQSASSSKIIPPFFNFNKENTKMKQKTNNLSQQDIQPSGLTNNDQSSKIIISSRNSPKKGQISKLSKILNESDQQKKESIQKFLFNNTSIPNRGYAQTSYGFKRISSNKLPFDVSQKSINLPNSSTQQPNSSLQQSIEANYSDTHILNGSTLENQNIEIQDNKFFMNTNNPFSKKKRSSHFMSNTITSFNKQQKVTSLQNSPRIEFNSKNNFSVQKPSQAETQANSMVSLIDELSGNELIKQSKQIYYPPLNKIQMRRKDKSHQEDNQIQQAPLSQIDSKDTLSSRQRNSSLPHFVLPNTSSSHKRISSYQQMLNNHSLKTILQTDNKELYPSKVKINIEKQNNRSSQNLDNIYEQQQQQSCNQEEQQQKARRELEQKKEISDKSLSQANLQLLFEKKRQVQLPFQSKQLVQPYSSTNKNKINLGMQNFFVASSNKKKMEITHKTSNGMVTTPSTINESLMATLNTFNLQKNQMPQYSINYQN